jgi:hypothetical protein
MRHVLAALLLGALALPVGAANRSCNATLVSQGVCRQNTNLLLYYDAPLTPFQDLRDAMLARHPRPAEVPCTAVRSFEPLANGQPSKLVATAGVTTDSCTLGTVVANPMTTGDWADGVIELELRNIVILWKNQAAIDVADDPESITTPDVGTP